MWHKGFDVFTTMHKTYILRIVEGARTYKGCKGRLFPAYLAWMGWGSDKIAQARGFNPSSNFKTKRGIYIIYNNKYANMDMYVYILNKYITY